MTAECFILMSDCPGRLGIVTVLQGSWFYVGHQVTIKKSYSQGWCEERGEMRIG